MISINGSRAALLMVEGKMMAIVAVQHNTMFLPAPNTLFFSPVTAAMSAVMR